MFDQIHKYWLSNPAISAKERAELLEISDDTNEIKDRFSSSLDFGTAGLRGLMGMGTNRMNIYTVAQTTQAFADVIISAKACSHGVCVCYDCRHNSKAFAQAVACVFAANGIPVRLFSDCRPTPQLSFAIRHFGLSAGVNITASHNPKEYNGYKVYWAGGAQLPPDMAAQVAKARENVDVFEGAKKIDFQSAVKSGIITMLREDFDELYINAVLQSAITPQFIAQADEAFKIVYTPFHGVGGFIVPQVLKRVGVKNLLTVAEQMQPDGDFPTVRSPNPENPEGFALAVDLAKKNNAQLIIGTDPDADRVGIIVRDKNGEYVPVSGNCTGVLLLDYIIAQRKSQGTLPKDPCLIKTIVTTPLAQAVAEQSSVACYNTFTGFKYMAEKVAELEASGLGNYIMAYEESYGYMIGDHARDKDGVCASMLLCELAAYYYCKGMTLFDALDEIFGRYGYYAEDTVNIVLPGLDGKAAMSSAMERLRKAPPRALCGDEISAMLDYSSGTLRDLNSGVTAQAELSGSDVLELRLSNGTRFLVRPSGTEPKMKAYVLAKGESSLEATALCAKYASAAQAFLGL